MTVVCPTCSGDICTHVVARALNADNALESALARAEQAEAREAALRQTIDEALSLYGRWYRSDPQVAVSHIAQALAATATSVASDRQPDHPWDTYVNPGMSTHTPCCDQPQSAHSGVSWRVYARATGAGE